jgi:hypothetical protein
MRFDLILFALVVCAFPWIARLCEKQTEGFTILGISSPFLPENAWETPALTAEEQIDLEKRLSQPYRFLASGGQAFAFLSDDGETVIKFFRQYRRTISPWLEPILSLPGLEKVKAKKSAYKREKLERDFTSCKIAIEKLKEECGMVFVHLNKTKTLGKRLTLVDKLGISHTINLDDFEFIVQRRAELAYHHLEGLVAKGEISVAQAAVKSMVHAIVSRCKKGVLDEDPRLHENMGFLDGHPVFIDVGRFRTDPQRKQEAFYKRDAHESTIRFRRWLLKHHPALAPALEEALHEI